MQVHVLRTSPSPSCEAWAALTRAHLAARAGSQAGLPASPPVHLQADCRLLPQLAVARGSTRRMLAGGATPASPPSNSSSNPNNTDISAALNSTITNTTAVNSTSPTENSTSPTHDSSHPPPPPGIMPASFYPPVSEYVMPLAQMGAILGASLGLGAVAAVVGFFVWHHLNEVWRGGAGSVRAQGLGR